MAIQEEILTILKQKLVPELGEMKATISDIQTDIKVVNQRLAAIEKRIGEDGDETEDIRWSLALCELNSMCDSLKKTRIQCDTLYTAP